MERASEKCLLQNMQKALCSHALHVMSFHFICLLLLIIVTMTCWLDFFADGDACHL